MKLLQFCIEGPVAGAIGWTLLYSLWEGAIISGLLAAVLVLFRSPRVRYIAACVAMLAVLGAFSLTLARMTSESTHGLRILTVPTFPRGWLPAGNDTPSARETNLAAAVPWLAPCWVAGVLLIDIRRLAGYALVQRLRGHGVCCTPERWQKDLTRLSAQLRISRPILLLESCLANVPMVLGHVRPLMLMPAGLLAGLPPGQIEAILLHELAHIRRHDSLVNLLQHFAESVLFYHPAVWWFSQLMSAERENCCDDIVVSTSGKRHEYAVALAVLEQNRLAGREPAVAVTGGSAVKRIRRLLYPKPNSPWAPFFAATVFIVTGVVFLAAWQAKPYHGSSGAVQAEAARALPAADAKWINGPVSYIITPRERVAFLGLTSDEERNKFIAQFWERRNPEPGSPENVFKQEFYRRVAFANKRFASSIPGWKTDRGHVYIAYGPPDEIKSGMQLLGGEPHAVETWFYRRTKWIGDNGVIFFVDATRLP